MIIHSPNTPTISPDEQALVLYHWLVFCCGFVELHSTHPFPVEASTTAGILNAASPSRVYTSVAFFDPTWVGHYIAVRDPNNPSNTCVVQITAFISSTEVQCNAPVANFNVSSTGVSLRVIDPTSVPLVSDYFVISNLLASSPGWQARVTLDVGPVVVVTFAPIGGWNPATTSFDLPVCSDVYCFGTVAQTFMIADPEVGWWSVLSEETGGVPSNRNMLWAGTLLPFHNAAVSGFPTDMSYAGIFGANSAIANNISRDSSVSNNICVGESLDSSLVPIVISIMIKTTMGGVDLMTLPAASTNPRSGAQDDYDCVIVEPTPGWRGRLPGMRILNDNLVNRTLLNSGATYVVGNGIGITWNGKPVV